MELAQWYARWERATPCLRHQAARPILPTAYQPSGYQLYALRTLEPTRYCALVYVPGIDHTWSTNHWLSAFPHRGLLGTVHLDKCCIYPFDKPGVVRVVPEVAVCRPTVLDEQRRDDGGRVAQSVAQPPRIMSPGLEAKAANRSFGSIGLSMSLMPTAFNESIQIEMTFVHASDAP